MTTRAYAAKKALFARWAALAVAGGPLEGIDVDYAWSGNAGARCVYGGGVRFTHEDAVAERGVLIAEVALVSVYIRVKAGPPAPPVQDTDDAAAAIFALIAADLHAQPELGGQMSFAAITQGQGDYDQPPDESVSILALQVRIETDLTYGGV